MHAVSVGETLAAIPLIKELKKSYPDVPLIVTNMTPTGAARVKAALNDSVCQVFIPYDLPGSVVRFLQRINPQVAVIMETELWPNLFAACKKRNIPIVLLNARLSQKSYSGYNAIRSLTCEMLKCIQKLAAQSRADADRFLALGMQPEKINVTGNLKFDLEIPADLHSKSILLREQLGPNRLIWIAASTHPTEEEIVLKAHKEILIKNPEALLILVPRHPDRFNTVATLCNNLGFKTVRRSLGSALTPDTSVYLGDTMGELLLMYSASDVTFVAGSFVSVGGHNMLEPAALKKPILTGPQLFNFAEISQMLIQEKGMIVVTPETLAEQVLKLFINQHGRQVMGDSAFRVVEQNRGSLQKQVGLAKMCIQA